MTFKKKKLFITKIDFNKIKNLPNYLEKFGTYRNKIVHLSTEKIARSAHQNSHQFD